jgi:hypothetical protein
MPMKHTLLLITALLLVLLAHLNAAEPLRASPGAEGFGAKAKGGRGGVVLNVASLNESDRVRQIFIRHVFRFFLGHNETPGHAVSLQEAEKTYLDDEGSLKATLVSLLSSESFLYRTMPTKGAKK